MSLYEVLGVAPTARPAEVRQAYLDLARAHHPDRRGGDAARMRAVNEAWATLGDPIRRAAYDRTLGAPPSAAPPSDPGPVHRGDDGDDLLADLADDSPIGERVVLPRWLSLLPVAVFAASIGATVAGLLFASSAALGAAIALFLLSCAMFLAAPFVALMSSRRVNR